MHECRICLEEGIGNGLIAPCNCSGTNKYVHRSCLDIWRATSDREDAYDTCPNCLVKYRFEKESFLQKVYRNCYNCFFHSRTLVCSGVAFFGFYAIPQIASGMISTGMSISTSLLCANLSWVGIALIPIIGLERFFTGDYERSQNLMAMRLSRSFCLSFGMTMAPLIGSLAHGVIVGVDLMSLPKRTFDIHRVLDLSSLDDS